MSEAQGNYFRSLDIIKKELGSFHLRMVLQSSQLCFLIKQVQAQLIFHSHMDTAAHTTGDEIHMGKNFNPVEFCQVYAHELFHCLQSHQSATFIPRELFIAMMLEDEVEAKLAEVDVLDELLEKGCCLTEAQKRLTTVQPSKRQETYYNWVWTAKVSTTGELYPEYYGRFWDEIHAEVAKI